MRLFATGRHRSRERVTERAPGQRFAYVLEAGLPLRDYTAVVTLSPDHGGGTTINWRSTFLAQVPRLGLDLPAQAGGVHRPDRRRSGWCGGRGPVARGLGSSSLGGFVGRGAFRRGPLGALEVDVREAQLGERLEQRWLGLPEAAAEAVEQGSHAVDGEAGLEELGCGLREVDGGQLKSP